jgi:heterogeneous nuclear ribonucleoprotein K
MKVYSECAPLSTERICQMKGKPNDIVACLKEVLILLESVCDNYWNHKKKKLIKVQSFFKAPPKGMNRPYDPHNFNEFLSSQYGGYLNEKRNQSGGNRNSSGGSNYQRNNSNQNSNNNVGNQRGGNFNNNSSNFNNNNDQRTGGNFNNRGGGNGSGSFNNQGRNNRSSNSNNNNLNNNRSNSVGRGQMTGNRKNHQGG